MSWIFNLFCDKTLVNNYRPISITNVISKLAKNVILLKFCKRNELISDSQFSFSEKLSTSDFYT